MRPKKWLTATMLALMLVPSGMNFQATTANAAAGTATENGPGDNIDPAPLPEKVSPYDIKIRRIAYNQNNGDGIIMNDSPVYPNSWSQAKNMAENPMWVAPDHTGWSTVGSVCERYIFRTDYYDKDGKPVSGPVAGGSKKDRYTSRWHNGEDDYAKRAPWNAFQYNTFNQLDSNSISLYIGQLKSKYANRPEHRGVNWDSVDGVLTGMGQYWRKTTREGTNATPHPDGGACLTGQYKWHYYDNEIVMEGDLRQHIDTPGGSKPSPGRNNGDVAGEAYWELVRHNESTNSGVDAFLNLKMTGNHYAVRGFQQQLSLGGQTVRGPQGQPLKIRVPDGYTVKNHNVNYSAAYEYTNFYKDIYRCTDGKNGYCYKWTFDKRVPDWDKVQTFTYSGSSPVNHEMFEVKQESRLEGFTGKNYKVGNKDTIQNKSSKQSTPYYENFSKGASNNRQSDISLKTQTGIPVTPGELSYSVSVPSGSQSNGGYKVLRREGTYGNMYPADVDTSLKSTYSNRSIIGGYQYAIPYQQSTYVDRGTSGGKRNLSWTYQSDLFLMGKHTGFQQGVNYTQDVKQNYLNNKSAPSESTARSRYTGTESALRSAYQSQTGQTLVDEMLPFDMEKAQRYMIPVEASSPLKPNVTHVNHRAIHNMGLNDMTFRYDQTFKFKRYLFGAIQDDAYIIEQTDPMVSLSDADQSKVKTIVISFDDAKRIAELNQTRTEKRVHEFRISDRNYIERIRQIVGEAQ